MQIARVFVAALLGLVALVVLGIVFLAALDISRQTRPHSVVHMGSIK